MYAVHCSCWQVFGGWEAASATRWYEMHGFDTIHDASAAPAVDPIDHCVAEVVLAMVIGITCGDGCLGISSLSYLQHSEWVS